MKPMGLRRTDRRTSGFSLLELVVTATLVGLMLSSAGFLTLRSYQAYRATSASAGLETRSRRALTRVASELVGTSLGVLLPDPAGDFGTESQSYAKPVDFTGGAIVYGPTQRLEWQLEPGELDDGSDQDGDGLVDEGVLVLVRDAGGAGETSTVLARGLAEYLEGETSDGDDENGNQLIDERGFSVSRVDQVLTVRLTMQARQPDGRVASRTLETSIQLRN
jgi:hypothetical protein